MWPCHPPCRNQKPQTKTTTILEKEKLEWITQNQKFAIDLDRHHAVLVTILSISFKVQSFTFFGGQHFGPCFHHVDGWLCCVGDQAIIRTVPQYGQVIKFCFSRRIGFFPNHTTRSSLVVVRDFAIIQYVHASRTPKTDLLESTSFLLHDRTKVCCASSQVQSFRFCFDT